jgi:long-chain acyl-CoA synthetase
MHRNTADRLGPRTALMFKRLGVYSQLSWGDCRRQADGAAAALIDLGVKPGDRIGLLAENRPEWVIADIAILSTGAADVPMHAPLAPAQVQYQLCHSGARGVIVSGQAQADKVLAIAEACPDLEWIVSFESVEIRAPLRNMTWDGLKQRGRQSQSLRDVIRRESAVTRDDLATIIYTSGTTGNPKGVMLTHGNLLSNAETTAEISGSRADDVLLSWLPYSHIYARTVDLYVTAAAGSTLCLAESVDTLIAQLAEIQPTHMASVPRFYEKVWASVAPLDKAARAAALHRMFGPRIRHISSGGAPLPRHIGEGFREAGMPLLEGYGLTESSPVISFNRLDAVKVGSVGQAIPDVEVKISADGEILTRGPHVMKGYWKNPDATREVLTADGWLHTGDVGYLDDNQFLYITDRKKDLIITSGGKNIAPSELERLLISDPYIDQAVVYGDGKPFPTALIVPSFPSLKQKANELGCDIEVEGAFITAPPLHRFYAERIEAVMQAVSNPERVKAFLILSRPFQLDAEELTATMKIRRRHVISKYAAELDRLYEGARASGSIAV